MKNILITFFILITTAFCLSQNENFRKVKPYTWMIGVYWNAVIDDGYGTKYLLDVPNSWNAPLFPSAVNVDVYLMKGMRLDFLVSVNEYKLVKRIDKVTTVTGLFVSLDSHFKCSFSYLMYQQWFDPFVF